VQGFPTIKAWVGGKLVEYQGDRSAGHLKSWALSLLPDKARRRAGPSFCKSCRQHACSTHRICQPPGLLPACMRRRG
jgi:hypothetical protein